MIEPFRMTERKNLCIFVAHLQPDERLVTRIGSAEAKHAAERCGHRIERAVAAHGGNLLRSSPDLLLASFERCDMGALAACDALNRVRALPPISSLRQPAHIGLHYGTVDVDTGLGEGVNMARRLAELSDAEQALASSAVVMLLTASARHLASANALKSTRLDTLGVDAFALGDRVGMVTSIPPNARLSQRLRLRHQEEILFVEEQRPVLLFGRELGNDVVIMDPRASRQHARIERQRAGFVLFDESSNGTFVSIEGEEERCLKGEQLLLRGPGRIGCGFSATEIERDLVFFDIV
jgi:adenylate cyclase